MMHKRILFRNQEHYVNSLSLLSALNSEGIMWIINRSIRIYNLKDKGYPKTYKYLKKKWS